MDKEQKIQEIEQRSKAVKAAGYAPCTFFPFSDLFIEIWPDDHPFIEEAFAKRPGIAHGDPRIVELNNPFEGKGALIGFGRQCLRFLVDEEGLQGYIDMLEELKTLVKDINNPDKEITTTDIPISINIKEYTFSMPEAKVFKEEEDIAELKGSDNRNLSLTEIIREDLTEAQHVREKN